MAWRSLRDSVRPTLNRDGAPSTRLIALGAISVALASLGLAWWIIAQSRAVAVDGAQTTVRNLALTLEQHAARSVEIVDLTIGLGADAVLRDHLAGAALHARLAELVRGSPRIATLELIDADGRRLGSSDAHVPTPGDPAGDEMFRTLRESAGADLVSGALVEAPDGQVRIPLARRMADAAGRFQGIAVATLEPDYFQAFYSTIDVGPNGVIALWAGDGRLLVRKPYNHDLVGIDYSALRLFRDLVPRAPIGDFEDRGLIDGTRRVATYRRVEGYPFVVLVGIGTADALTDWRRNSALVAGAGLVLAAASLVLGWFAARDQRERALTAQRIGQTVAELTQAREAAEQSNRAKTQFLARMSHELRTPMNAILGFSDVISRGMFGPLHERYRQYGRDIHQSGLHLLALINDILDFSKIEAGRRELTAERIDLGSAIAETLRIEGPAIETAGLGLEVELGDPPATLVADRRAIIQMLLNLLSNSVKFTPRGGRIRITAARSSDGLVLAVHDTGIGIAPKDHARVLEPFGQVADATTDQRSGTGLGLSIVKSLMELHGGRLVLDSEPGVGTTISLWFPPWRVVT